MGGCLCCVGDTTAVLLPLLSLRFAEVVVGCGCRMKFASELARMCKENDLDGIDVDWEHPFNIDQRPIPG